MTGMAMLSVSELRAGYGDVTVLEDVSFDVPADGIVAIVGANGAGKTTLLSTIAGLIAPKSGRVVLRGKDVSRLAAHARPGLGMAMVPEGGRLFPFLTVAENLELGAYDPSARGAMRERLEEVTAIFPILRERRSQLAGRLSGGERQMCAIARALMSRPRLLLLDEPSVGLSPLMVERVLETIVDLARREKLTVLVVEQRVTEVLEIADFGHVLDHGRIVQADTAERLRNDRRIQQTYMGL
jgi:branched-chain amino acid transport system ATP-binding protein